MNCCQCQGIEAIFDKDFAERDLKAYHEKGPEKSTRLLLDALQERGVTEASLLDIGGGIGAIQHALAKSGVSQITNVDASTAYLNAAKAEATVQGYVDTASYHHGDFVELALTIEPVDIVTLDRVLCCYPDMAALVSASAQRAKRQYGLVFPRDVWWIRLGRPVFNSVMWLMRSPFRFFVHATDEVDAILQAHGLSRQFHRKLFIWQVLVYERTGSRGAEDQGSGVKG